MAIMFSSRDVVDNISLQYRQMEGIGIMKCNKNIDLSLFYFLLVYFNLF